ncbi:MAG: phosphatase PAP2 family protein [Clostridia bacterium]|nr:phosphatase PAP2 family protein [Clostridia bacterium]
MNKIINFIKKISYSILPLVLFVVSLLLSWYLNQVITNGTQPGDWHYGTTWPHTALDDKIPLVPAFVYIYYLTFPAGLFTFFYLAYKNKTKLYNIFLTLVVSFLISGIIYFFFQSRFVKPDFTPDSFTDKLVVWTWNASHPTNVFPSQHCYMGLACCLACIDTKEMHWSYRIIGTIIGILVCMSTVFTKQHYWIDFVASFAIMVPTFFVVKYCKLGKKAEQKFDNFYAKTYQIYLNRKNKKDKTPKN